MEIVPLELDGKTGAEARRKGARIAHVVERLDEAESRGKHVWVGLEVHSLAAGARRGFVPTHVRLRRDVQPAA